MIILFNWKKILRRAKYKQGRALKIFYYLSHDLEIKSLEDPMSPLMLGMDYSGSSFVLNPKPIFSGKYTDLERIQYIAMASLRSYPEYKLRKTTTLHFLLSPLSEKQINNNRLLNLDNNQIRFKYEG